MEQMTVAEYTQLLERHDWHYQMSDDPRAYEQGRQERQRIVALAESNPEFAKLLQKYRR